MLKRWAGPAAVVCGLKLSREKLNETTASSTTAPAAVYRALRDIVVGICVAAGADPC